MPTVTRVDAPGEKNVSDSPAGTAEAAGDRRARASVIPAREDVDVVMVAMSIWLRDRISLSGKSIGRQRGFSGDGRSRS
jgi:hypothetical protein